MKDFEPIVQQPYSQMPHCQALAQSSQMLQQWALSSQAYSFLTSVLYAVLKVRFVPLKDLECEKYYP